MITIPTVLYGVGATALVSWVTWVSLQVAQIKHLVTKVELLESEKRTKDDIISAFKEAMKESKQ